MAKIETGVDKLVQLVNDKKKLSLEDASKELGVSTDVVREWSEFLDEEGLIGIEYSLSKTFLVERKLTKGDVEKKAQDYEQKKEAFVRKVDTTLKQLEKEASGFEEIKRAYNSLKEDIGDEIDQVKHELDEMKHYESLKQSIDQDIIQQKVDYQKMVDDVHRKLYAEEKRYEKLLKEMGGEEQSITAQREEFKSLEEKESSLQKRLDALKTVVDEISTELASKSKAIADQESRLTRLHEIASTIEKDIKRKKGEELEPMIKASKEHGEKIIQVQDSILRKVQERKGTVSAFEKQAQGVVDKFDVFFKKRMETEKMLNELERKKAEMAHELEGLKQKAVAFNLMTKGADVKKHIAELEHGFKEFDRRKGIFRGELDKFKHFIGAE